MKTLTKKDIFVQKLKNRPIHVRGKDTISNEDLTLLLKCNIIENFIVRKPVSARTNYRVLYCIHLTHTHLSPTGNWLDSTKIINPGMWV